MKKKVYNQPKLVSLGSVTVKTMSTVRSAISDNGNNNMAPS